MTTYLQYSGKIVSKFDSTSAQASFKGVSGPPIWSNFLFWSILRSIHFWKAEVMYLKKKKKKKKKKGLKKSRKKLLMVTFIHLRHDT